MTCRFSSLALPSLLLFACSGKDAPPADAGRDLAPDGQSLDDGATERAPDDGAPVADLPAWVDGGDAGTGLDGRPRFDGPSPTDPAKAKLIGEQSAEQPLWHLQSGGAGAVNVSAAWPAGGGKLGLLLNVTGEVTLGDETLSAAGAANRQLLVTLDGAEVISQMALISGANCHAVAPLGDDLALACGSSGEATLLPDSAQPQVVAAPQDGQHLLLLRLADDGELAWVRRLQGASSDTPPALRGAGARVLLAGSFDAELLLDGTQALARQAPAPAGSYWGSGFALALDAKTGALAVSMAIDGQATSRVYDVAPRADGGFYACGLVGGYSGTGVSFGTFNHGQASEIVFAGYSDDDPSGTPYLARFDSKAQALWVRAAHTRSDFFGGPICELSVPSPKHVRVAVHSDNLPVGFAGGGALLVSGPAPVALYQDDGTPVSASTFATAGGWGRMPALSSPTRWLLRAQESVIFDPYGTAPRELPLTSTVGKGNFPVFVVADVDAGSGALQAVRWGLRPAVSQGSLPPLRLVPVGADEAVVVGSSGPGISFGELTVADGPGQQLFVVAAKLATGAL